MVDTLLFHVSFDMCVLRSLVMNIEHESESEGKCQSDRERGLLTSLCVGILKTNAKVQKLIKVPSKQKIGVAIFPFKISTFSVSFHFIKSGLFLSSSSSS